MNNQKNICGENTTYNSTTKKCEINPVVCGDDTNFSESGKCEVDKDDYNPQLCGINTIYNSQTEKCEIQSTVCGRNTKYNTDTGVCEVDTANYNPTICDPNTKYNSKTQKCEVDTVKYNPKVCDTKSTSYNQNSKLCSADGNKVCGNNTAFIDGECQITDNCLRDGLVCSKNGKCVDGKCVCNTGFKGTFCSSTNKNVVNGWPSLTMIVHIN